MKKVSKDEVLRRHRIVYHAIHSHMSARQIEIAFTLWEKEFSLEPSFKIYDLYQRLCEALTLRPEVAKVVNDRLMRGVNLKLGALAPTPFENEYEPSMQSQDDSLYQSVINTIGLQIGFENAEKVMARQLKRLSIRESGFTKSHLKQSMASLKGAISLYTRKPAEAGLILTRIEGLLDGGRDNIFHLTKQILEQYIAPKDVKKILSRQLTRSAVSESAFSLKHLNISMLSLKGSISLYCRDAEKIRQIEQKLNLLISGARHGHTR
ncbi:MAG: hypothetical protein GY820_45605 [Gammaproteobacteria bacterium]|nr:hypothetical protein [Gammaproteobacteria bacterium]